MRWMHACSSLLNVCPLHTQQWYFSTYNNSFITLHVPLQLTPLSTIYDFLSQVKLAIYYKEASFPTSSWHALGFWLYVFGDFKCLANQLFSFHLEACILYAFHFFIQCMWGLLSFTFFFPLIIKLQTFLNTCALYCFLYISAKVCIMCVPI